MTDETGRPSISARRTPGLLRLVLAIAGGLAVLVGLLALVSPSVPRSGPAPSFTLTTFSGETVDLNVLRGQVVVLNFWASWCAPCRAEAPYLEQLAQMYRDRGLVVLGVTYKDTPADSQAFIDDFDLTYLNAPDPDERVAQAYGIQAAPTTFVIDREGAIALFVQGPVDQNPGAAQLSSTLERLLGESRTD